MNRGWAVFAAGILAAALFSCGGTGGEDSSGGRFTMAQLKAEFPEDLGPASIDVSDYPPEMQALYPMVAAKCSQCHTFARVVNSPYIAEADWTRFVYQMHARAIKLINKPLFDGDDAKKIVKFLVFDSKERKLKRATEFRRTREDLNMLFREIQEAKAAQQGTAEERESGGDVPAGGDNPS